MVSVSGISSIIPWTSPFRSSNILGKDASNRSVFVTVSTSAKVCGLLWLVSPPVGPVCCSGLTGSLIYLPVLGYGYGGALSLGYGSVGVLPWITFSRWISSVSSCWES